MEVHHHSDHHGGTKRFKDYFQEFLMIFLAVTMGFLAENVREYITDNNHVVELVGQLKEDLLNDTANIEKLVSSLKIQMSRTDSLFILLTDPGKQKDFIRMQELIKNSDNLNIFYPSTGAISTIKTELHLKKFVKTKLSSHIDNYEKKINVLNEVENRDLEYMGKILESFMSKHFTPENAAAVVMQKPFVNGTLRNLTDDDLIQLSVDINLLKAYNRQLYYRCIEIKSDAEAFIRHLNATYNLNE
jgi:hypothetical protein